jgi:hypothetical protein
MSTKSAIAKGENWHVYRDLFEQDRVCLEIINPVAAEHRSYLDFFEGAPARSSCITIGIGLRRRPKTQTEDVNE